MPKGNFNGPMGMGPMSGRGAGFCAGHEAPGFAYPGHHMRGMRRAWHGHGWFGHHRMPMGYHGWQSMDFAAYEVPYPADMTPEEKMDMLSTREAWLQEQLEEVRKELGDLESAKADTGKETKKTDD